MKKGILRKVISAVLVLSLVIAVMPTMFASAAEVGDKIVMGFAPRNINIYELNAGGTAKIADITTLGNYVDKGTAAYDTKKTYYRNWKYFAQNFSGTSSMSAPNGLNFSDGKNKDWFAIKIRGFESGIYNIKINAVPQKGCIWGLYLLDDSVYGSADITTITTAVETSSSGVIKIGEADLYGRAEIPNSTSNFIYDSAAPANKITTNTTPYNEIEFGNVKLTGDASTEYILLFRVERDGVLDGEETSISKTAGYISMFALSFTKTTAAKNADVFGDTAAFIEHTDNGTSNLYLISAIDSLDYSEVGFKLGDAEERIETDTVYERLTMTNDDDSTLSYTATDFGLSGKYLYVVRKTLTEGFTGQIINFKPYAVSVGGETTIEGSTYQATLKSN